MTNMRRVTISVPDEMDRQILETKKEDRFVRASYSEVVRQLVLDGLTRKADKPSEGEREEDAG